MIGYNTYTWPTTLLMNYGWSGNTDGWYTVDTCLYPYDFSRLVFVVPNSGVEFVGKSQSGDSNPDNPIDVLNTAVSIVPNNSTLILKAGGVITKPLTINGTNVTIVKQ